MSNISEDAVALGNETETFTAPFIFALVSDVVVGALGQMGSLFVIVIMMSNKQMRTNCFQLIAAGAVGSVMVAAYYFGRGIDKIGEATGTMLSTERSALVCLLTTGSQAMFGIPYHAIMTCLVGLDRTISLLAPVKYRTFGKTYIIYMALGSAILVLIQEIVGFVTAPLSDTISCKDFPEALAPTFIDTFAGLNLFYCTAIVGVYGAMLACFYCRKMKSRQENMDREFGIFMKQQSAAMPTVILMTVLYFFFGIMAEILINIAINLENGEWAGSIMVFGDFLKAMSSLVEIVSLTVCSTKFRVTAKALLGIKQNVVKTVVVTASGRTDMGA